MVVRCPYTGPNTSIYSIICTYYLQLPVTEIHPLHEPTACPHCDEETLQTRQHILAECPWYVNPFPSMTDWGKNRHNHKALIGFLDRNPSAFTFGDCPLDVHWTAKIFGTPPRLRAVFVYMRLRAAISFLLLLVSIATIALVRSILLGSQLPSPL